MSLPAGNIKHYKLLRPIGKGGMGEVFLAQDTILDRKVAIKSLPRDLQDDLAFRERFFREAKAAAALDHPFICKIYETGEIQGRAYIVMEYIEGTSLMEQMQDEPPSLKDSLRITSEIAEALEKAHENKIVHRDLKPANIMLTPQGHVKIMDFGLAKKVLSQGDVGLPELRLTPRPKSAPRPAQADDLMATIRDESQDVEADSERARTILDATLAAPEDPAQTIREDGGETRLGGADTSGLRGASATDMSKVGLQSSLTQYGTLVGTLAYMSPEQAKGEEIDVRSDIFALGVILYELIAKTHPFLRKDSTRTLKAITSQPFPPLKLKPKKLGSGLTPIFKKALAKDVEQRYQSVKDFSQDLQKMQKVLRIGSPLFYLSRPAQALLAALLIVVVAGTFWLARRGRISAAELNREPVSVLVADFQNMTGESVFDGAVEQALNIGLEGASFIAAYNRPNARQVISQMDSNAGGRLNSQMAQLFCVREGISMFIDGTIEKKGDGYLLKAWLKDPVNPENVTEYSRSASSKDEILSTSAWLANKVREGLGDKSADAKQALSAETFTTSSLEAMNAYTHAQELNTQGKQEEAIAEYMRAIEEDPDFGRAYSGLALVYQNRGQSEEADKYFKEALARIDRMSEREKYRTRAIYHLIQRNFQKAIEECESLVSKYPADFSGQTNLALAYFFARNYSRAKEVGRQAADLYPKIVTSRFNLSWYALVDGDFEMAEQEAQQVVELNPDYDEVYMVLALSRLGRGQLAQAIETYEKLKTIPPLGESLADLGLADIAIYEGRLSDAITILERRIAMDLKEGRSDYLGNKWSILASARLASGKKALALEASDRAVDSSRRMSTLIFAARTYIQANKEEKARSIAEELGKRLGEEPRSYAKLIEGEIEEQRGNSLEAIELFKAALAIHDTWLGRFALGKAYLDLEAFPDAHAELDLCLRRHGEATSLFFDDVPSYHLLPPVYYYLGRAQEGLGSAAASESYEKFIQIKEKEDWGDPLVEDARNRLNTLLSR
jgi:serine/threonine protein kinase/Tfp pilus assembly protein PilF